MKISLIVAFDNNFGIGKDNKLLWNLPNDLKHFKEITTGKTILMGRSTYESIGKPLPNRFNLILSTNIDYLVDGCVVLNSLNKAIKYCKINNVDELIIIGGGKLYAEVFDLCTTLYVTHVNSSFDADTFFPKINYKEWNLIETKEHIADEKHKYNYSFSKYIKK